MIHVLAHDASNKSKVSNFLAMTYSLHHDTTTTIFYHCLHMTTPKKLSTFLPAPLAIIKSKDVEFELITPSPFLSELSCYRCYSAISLTIKEPRNETTIFYIHKSRLTISKQGPYITSTFITLHSSFHSALRN